MAAGEPVWALATKFPPQGAWSEGEYLAFESAHPRIEFCDGSLEVLPAATDRHQSLLTAILLLLIARARVCGGVARPAGVRVRLKPGRIREPDVVFLASAKSQKRGPEFWTGADLVVEVMSPSADDRVRDLVTKREEYAAAGIPEYWIVDPEAETILVLSLAGDAYRAIGEFGRGTRFESPTQAGLFVEVSDVLDAE
jgi:Uma2 family endonuclease